MHPRARRRVWKLSALWTHRPRPQPLGNLAGEREILTFPQPIIFVADEKRREKNERYEVNHVSHTKILTLP